MSSNFDIRTATEHSTKVTNSLKISINGAHADADLEKPLWAINWFNTKSKFLYSLYGLLVFPAVKRAGAKVLFKGHIINNLNNQTDSETTPYEKDQYQRDTLLIVCYPNAAAFIQMVRKKTFQLFSLLRIAAVKNFTFGFTKRLDTANQKIRLPKRYNGSCQYLVHHLQASRDIIIENQDNIKNIAEKHAVTFYFSGLREAHLDYTKNHSINSREFFIDALFLFEAEDTEHLESFKDDVEYQLFISKTQNSGLYLFARDL